MSDSPGPSGYPPSRNAWQFSPLRTRARTRWLVALTTVLAVVVAGGLVAVLSTVDAGDSPDLLDDRELIDTIAAECVLMTTTVASMPLSGGTPDQARTIVDQNRAVEIMVRSVRASSAARIRDDPPAARWLDDWELLVDARARWARELLRDPRASLRVPLDADGTDVTERMDDVWRGTPRCEVPDALVLPYTDAFSGV